MTEQSKGALRAAIGLVVRGYLDEDQIEDIATAVINLGWKPPAGPKPESGVTVHFAGGPWDKQTTTLDRVVGPVLGPGHEVGSHYWLDTKGNPPTYHWDGTPWQTVAAPCSDPGTGEA